MPDAIFAHPRLAKVYDAFDGPRTLDGYRILDVRDAPDREYVFITQHEIHTERGRHPAPPPPRAVAAN